MVSLDTGRLPVDLEATDVLEAVRLVCEAEPRRPRQFAPSLAADLETIILKTLEKDPHRRYASAGALGADLSSWRANRPVVARRIGVVYRSARFVQRHRALTTSALVVVTALAVGLALALGGLRAEREARASTSAALEDLAAKIFDLSPQLGFGEEQRSGLEEVERRIGQQLLMDPENRALRATRARAHSELMTLDLVRGDAVTAELHGHAARELLEALTREQPSELVHWTALAQVYARLGEARRGLGDRAGREAWFQRAFELDERLVREHPGDRDLIEDLGWSICRLLAGCEDEGDYERASQLIERRLADALAIHAAEPDNWKYVYNLSHAHAITSDAHLERSEIAEAKRHAEEAVRLSGRLLEMQRGRRDFIQWNVEASRLAMESLEAEGDSRAALHYATLRFGGACELFYGDPLRELHAYFFQTSARDVHRLATLLGDEDIRARVRSRMHDAVALAQVAHAAESLAMLEAVALEVQSPIAENELRAGTGQE